MTYYEHIDGDICMYKTGSVDVDDHVGGDSVQAKVATIWLLTYCHWMD